MKFGKVSGSNPLFSTKLIISIKKLILKYRGISPDKSGLMSVPNEIREGQRFEPAILHKMFSVYIIYSFKIDKYYIGQTENIENRLYRHNNNGSKSTKKANDWVLKYAEEFPTRVLAMKREAALKKKKSRVFIESLIRS